MNDEEQNNVPSDLDEPMKPSNPLKKAKTTGKTVVNTTFNFTKKAISFFTNPAVPLPIKIGLISVIAIVILVVVILDVEADENAKAITNTISSYINNENVDEVGKKLFQEKASLIKFPLKDINSMYEQFVSDKEFSNTVIDNYSYILGTKDVKDGGGGSSSTASSDLNNLVQKAKSMAEKGGIKYCQPDRQTASTIEELDAIEKTDCSGFVYSLFKVYLNIDVGSSTSDMLSKGENGHSENGWTAEKHDLKSIDELQPGDLLLRDGHVAVYVGDGKLVDNGGPGGGDCACSSDWRGPRNKDVSLSSYQYYVRYTNPNATGGGVVDSNGNEAEGYQSGFTDSQGRSYKIYKQWMEPWASHSYWAGKMKNYGCGPTTLAIIASGYGKNKTPGEIADYMTSQGYVTNQDSLSATLTNMLGIKNTKVNSNFESVIKKNLNAGKPLIVSVTSSPDTRFTKSSHIIALLDIRNDSEVFIGNVGANDIYTEKCGWNTISGLLPYANYLLTIDE